MNSQPQAGQTRDCLATAMLAPDGTAPFDASTRAVTDRIDLSRIGLLRAGARTASYQTSLVSVGLSNKEIAHHLSLSEGTVKIHLHNIFRKLPREEPHGRLVALQGTLHLRITVRLDARSRALKPDNIQIAFFHRST